MSLKLRVWIEAVLAGIATVLTLVTLVWPDWIEWLFDESPDGGDGSAERAFALGWIAAALLFGWLARQDWRRLRAAAAPGQVSATSPPTA